MAVMGRAVRLWCLSGVAAAVLAWVVIAAAWLRNPWFDVFDDAFSDLGVPGQARDAWIYNYGLMATGALTVLYGLFVYRWAESKLEALAAGWLMIAGVFLALIGVYPGGTRPHVFVSTWFFIQMDLALIPLLYSLWRRRGFRLAMPAFAAAVLAFPVFMLVEYTVGWPSVAIGEAYGIIIIDYAVLTATIAQCRDV